MKTLQNNQNLPIRIHMRRFTPLGLLIQLFLLLLLLL